MLLVAIGGVGNVVGPLEAFEELADLVRRSLAVVIKADEEVPRAVADAGHERRVLAEVLREVDGSDVPVASASAEMTAKVSSGEESLTRMISYS